MEAMSLAELRSWNAIAVYCGSKTGALPVYAEVAGALGRTLAERSLTLVYGGGSVGLMGVVADATMASGGEVLGVITDALHAAEVGHPGITTLEVVPSMHIRKARMADLADASIVLPGGFGTLDEFMETVTWNQLGVHAKPCGVLNINGYFDPLLEFIDRAVDQGFIAEQYADSIMVADDPEELLDDLRSVILPRGITANQPEFR